MYFGSDGFLRAVESHGVSLREAAGWGGDEWIAEDGYCPACHGREAGQRMLTSRQKNRGAKANEPDRVRLFPVDAGKLSRRNGHWYCHRCEANGDGIDFLRRRFGLSFVDAFKAIHGMPPPDRQGWKSAPPKGRASPATARPEPAATFPMGGQTTPPKTMRGTPPAAKQAPLRQASLPPAPEAKTAEPWRIQANPWPCMEWEAQARVLACKLDPLNRDCVGASYVQGRRALEEARAQIEQGRGIPLEVASACGVYWNPVSDLFFPSSAWGLKRKTIDRATGEEKEAKLWVPRGIVIALTRYRYERHTESGTIVGLLVRCADPEVTGCKLRWVPFRDDGSDLPRTRTMVLGMAGQPAVVTESALDAVLLYYQSEGRLAAVSTCGAAYPLDEDAAELLRSAPRLWAWPDADEAGREAFAKWRRAFPAMQAIHMPKGADGMPAAKDPTELARLSKAHPELPTVRQILETQGVLDD